MIALLADENLNRNIVRALVRRRPEIDATLAQEAGLTGSSDAILLEWAATHGRVVLSHDFRTLAAAAEKRLRDGEPMSGLPRIQRRMPVGEATEDSLMIPECSGAADWGGSIQYLPP